MSTTDSDTAAATSTARVTPHMEQIDPGTLLVDLNVRRDSTPDKTLVESIRDLGVLVPLVAVRTDEGVRVRYGHRRTLAAIEAARPSVPVWVFDADGGTDVDRIVRQWAENEHRENLTDADRLAAVEQLSAFGVSAAQITKRLKTKRGQVDAALSVAKSPLAKAATERYGFLTLDQAATLAEFDCDTDAETVKALVVAAKDSPGQFAHIAQRARDEKAEQARQQAARDVITATGVPVLDGRAPTRWGTPEGPERLLSDLTDPDGQLLTANAHAGCPGHAAYLVIERGYWTPEQAATVRLGDEPASAGGGWGYEDPEDYDASEDDDDLDGEDPAEEAGGDDEGDGEPATAWGPRYAAVHVCRDYVAQGHRARPTGYSGRSEPAPLTEAEAAEAKEAARVERRRVIENNKQWASAETVRREWLTAFLARKTAPKGSALFVAQSLAHAGHALTQALTYSHRLGRVLFGCPETPATYGRGSAVIAGLLDAATERRAEMVTLGMVLAAFEDNTGKHSWRNVDPSTAAYLRFLAEHGYGLSDVEWLACGETPLPDADAEEPVGPTDAAA